MNEVGMKNLHFFVMGEKCHEYVKYDKKRQFHDTVND